MFDTKKRNELVIELQNYFADELSQDLGQFDGEFLLDFIITKMGPAFYNQGLNDAKQVVERKLLDISDEIYEIEKEE
ncbi:DUF2164 domain-containing protein [Vibrio hippocampi]|uniref:DUF2164 domain-containing protein n=1 Tax=Vibrio hippocampi TaxID=654686 RepID=A0ABM8ZLY9_9VIBR|nr:DUF2164 domain-containing protein [Vibrio hippocampi]CAH0529542.1 hypothetical protein VHP8226_03296 [Vibrio hippocampi]